MVLHTRLNPPSARRYPPPRFWQGVFLVVSTIALGLYMSWHSLWLLLPLLLFTEIALLFKSPVTIRHFHRDETSPWKSLRVNDGYLYICANALPVSSVPTAVLTHQGVYATLQLPQNRVNGQIPIVTFSPVYFPAVKAFIRLRLPYTTMRILAADNLLLPDVKKAS